jgi:hypothetical protein
MHEMNTKNAVIQFPLNAVSHPLSREKSIIENNRNAPNVKGNAFKNKDRLSVFSPCFKCDQPVKLCCPIKYRPNEVSSGN